MALQAAYTYYGPTGSWCSTTTCSGLYIPSPLQSPHCLPCLCNGRSSWRSRRLQPYVAEAAAWCTDGYTWCAYTYYGLSLPAGLRAMPRTPLLATARPSVLFRRHMRGGAAVAAAAVSWPHRLAVRRTPRLVRTRGASPVAIAHAGAGCLARGHPACRSSLQGQSPLRTLATLTRSPAAALTRGDSRTRLATRGVTTRDGSMASGWQFMCTRPHVFLLRTGS